MFFQEKKLLRHSQVMTNQGPEIEIQEKLQLKKLLLHFVVFVWPVRKKQCWLTVMIFAVNV